MLGEYDFSEDILQDSMGILLPKRSPVRPRQLGGT